MLQRPIIFWLALCSLTLTVIGCGVFGPRPASPTPDYPRLETQVAIKLMATLTAKAPTPTATSTPTATAQPTPTVLTRTPSATATPTPVSGAVLAMVRLAEEQAANVVLYSVADQHEQVLTHFAEPLNMSDLRWSHDGQWLIMVSTHDYIASASSERNVFMLRPDGTDLQMVTGDYVDPRKAPGPYAILNGQVLSATSPCRVYAQGASGAVVTAEDGSFELPGVPVAAKWARAVCPEETLLLEGHMPLEVTAEVFAPITITVQARGQGWRQASLSPDGQVLAGTTYTWTLDADGAVVTALEGMLYSIEDEQVTMLALPDGAVLGGLDWSPDGTQLVGALASDEGASLWLWSAQGESLGPLVELANPESELFAAASPAWSPDGARIAFELRRNYWWRDPQYRVDLMAASVAEQQAELLVENPWGTDALHPSWSADSSLVYYQRTVGDPAQSYQARTGGDIWAVPIARPTPFQFTTDGLSTMPAVRPVVRTIPIEVPGPTVTASP